MSLKIYNTLTRRTEPFEPLEPGKVTLYCCGVTVYDHCHLGHARSYIGWDIVRRYFQWRGFQVRYVQNFTDVDDKILNRARAEGSSMQAVSDRFIQAYFEDTRRLNVIDADEYPRVTEHMPVILEMIQALERKGYAYAVDGDVYYKVRQFQGYGKLSGRQLEQQQAGASGRVAAVELDEPKKQDPFDFALWKAAKPNEPAWESPWGMGRPGWHIECSAMIRARLGETIDIHGGGGDLVFPHHENEIAQSEALTGKPLAHYWLHNGMVTVNGEKMSKSLGNFTTIRELLDRPVDPMVVRLFVLQGHYRKPLDFTEAALLSAQNSWQTLKEGLAFGAQFSWDATHTSPQLDTEVVEQFQTAMDDDFNTPVALVALFAIAKQLRRESNLLLHEGKTETSQPLLQTQWHTLVYLAEVLGLQVESQANTPGNLSLGIEEGQIERLVQQRQTARQNQHFLEADRIRNELQAAGVVLIDQADGITHWRIEQDSNQVRKNDQQSTD